MKKSGASCGVTGIAGPRIGGEHSHQVRD